MHCPGCGADMRVGELRGEGGHGVYWMPLGCRPAGWFLHPGAIRAQGGVVLDQVTSVGFLAQSRPHSYYCGTCRMLVVKL